LEKERSRSDEESEIQKIELKSEVKENKIPEA